MIKESVLNIQKSKSSLPNQPANLYFRNKTTHKSESLYFHI